MAIAETLLANKIQLAIAGLVVLGGAGATYMVFADGGEAEIDRVPEDVDTVVYMDPSVAEDQTTKDLLNGLIDRAKENLGDSYSGPDDYEEMMDNASSDSELDQEKLHSVTMYATYPDASEMGSAGSAGMAGGLSNSSYLGIIIDSDWDEETFVEETENGSDYEQDEYEGYTVYVAEDDDEQDGWLGVLSDGTYVLGTEAAVKDAIDVDRGETDSVDGGLRDAYEDTRSGDDTYFKFASRFPEKDELNGSDSSTVSETEYAAVEDITYLSGSYYTKNDEEIGMQVRMQTDSSASADDLASVTDMGVTKVKRNATSEEMQTLYEEIDVEQDGSVVTVTFESPVDDLVDGIEAALKEWFALLAGTFSSDSGMDTGYDADGSKSAVGPASVVVEPLA